MVQRMTWEEMRRAYPNEWILIVDCETDESGSVVAGVVERHSTNDVEVFRLPAVEKPAAFKYTGESTFPGGWRAHAECHNL